MDENVFSEAAVAEMGLKSCGYLLLLLLVGMAIRWWRARREVPLHTHKCGDSPASDEHLVKLKQVVPLGLDQRLVLIHWQGKQLLLGVSRTSSSVLEWCWASPVSDLALEDAGVNKPNNQEGVNLALDLEQALAGLGRFRRKGGFDA